MPISCTTHIGNGLGECERCRIPLPLIQHDGMSTIPKGRVGLQFGGIAILCAVTELENWLRERRRKRVEDAR